MTARGLVGSGSPWSKVVWPIGAGGAPAGSRRDTMAFDASLIRINDVNDLEG